MTRHQSVLPSPCERGQTSASGGKRMFGLNDSFLVLHCCSRLVPVERGVIIKCGVKFMQQFFSVSVDKHISGIGVDSSHCKKNQVGCFQ